MNTRSSSPAGMAMDFALKRRTGDLFPGKRSPLAGTAGCWIASLRQRRDWPLSPLARIREAAKYLARALCLPRAHSAYLRFVQDQPHMRACRDRDPRLLERHLHRFVNRKWRRRDRLRALRSHYQFAIGRWPSALFDAIYVEGGLPLGLLALKDGRELVLSLRPPIDKGCEGELGIQLEELGGRTLYRVVLTVTDCGRTLAIGCLQGPGGADAREVVRELTRQMHGLRPKQLMLSLAGAFARHFGIGRMVGVANDAHPLSRRRAGLFQADYDAFWLEQHGEAQAGSGWFNLPVEPPRKSEAEVPSHHRAAFRRRETLRIAAEALLTAAFSRRPSPADITMEVAMRPPVSVPVLQERAWIP